MSRTKKKSKPIGFDFWSRRFPSTSIGFGKFAKWLTHRFERNMNKKIIRNELKDYESEK